MGSGDYCTLVTDTAMNSQIVKTVYNCSEPRQVHAMVSNNPVPAGELDISSMQLGIDDLEFALSSREHVRGVALALTQQAQRELLLYTDDLEPDIFDQQPFLDAVSELARQHQDTQVRILVENSRKTVQQGHRLIELSRRLSSHIQLRRPPVQYRNHGSTFMLCDGTGYFYRTLSSRYEGTASFNNPGQAAVHRKHFMEVWEQSQDDEEIRRLHL